MTTMFDSNLRDKILKNADLIKTDSIPARDWGNEVFEIWMTPEGRYYRLSYNDAYPEGRMSKWCTVEEVYEVTPERKFTRVKK